VTPREVDRLHFLHPAKPLAVVIPFLSPTPSDFLGLVDEGHDLGRKYDSLEIPLKRNAQQVCAKGALLAWRSCGAHTRDFIGRNLVCRLGADALAQGRRSRVRGGFPCITRVTEAIEGFGEKVGFG
jgi:hypothetical protein